MNARVRFGAVLLTGAACLLLFWFVRGPDAAVARTEGTGSSPTDGTGWSERASQPKEGQTPAPQVVPEGIDMTETSAPDVAPVRLAQAEAPAENPPAVEAEPPAAEAAAEAGPGLLNIESGHPLSITADELEAIELPDGRRQLLFNRSVNVEQGGLLVRSNRLEAHYAAKATQPDRLVASGDVRVKQKSRELSCAKATYYPSDERLECVGDAQLLDGSNRVNGDRIEILFAQDRIRVKGGAVVNVVPDEDEDEAPPAAAEATP